MTSMYVKDYEMNDDYAGCRYPKGVLEKHDTFEIQYYQSHRTPYFPITFNDEKLQVLALKNLEDRG
jgi:hypothetical protein